MTPLGSGGGAGGSPRGSTTLRLLLRETPLGSFFYFEVERTHELSDSSLCWFGGLADTACRVHSVLT